VLDGELLGFPLGMSLDSVKGKLLGLLLCRTTTVGFVIGVPLTLSIGLSLMSRDADGDAMNLVLGLRLGTKLGTADD
jgi:hypothetical protein